MKDFFTCFDWYSFWMNVLVSTIFLIVSIVISIKLIPYFTLKLIEKRRRPFVVSKIAVLLLELCEFFEKSEFKTIDICQENISIYKNFQKRDKEFIGLLMYNITDNNVQKAIYREIKRSEHQHGIEEGLKRIEKEYRKIVELKSKLESFMNTHNLDVNTDYLILISDICLKIRAFEIKFNRNYNSKDLFDKGMQRHQIDGLTELIQCYTQIIQLFIKLVENSNIKFTIETNQSQAERSF